MSRLPHLRPHAEEVAAPRAAAPEGLDGAVREQGGVPELVPRRVQHRFATGLPLLFLMSR